jgi:two-component system LytT family response regulator
MENITCIIVDKDSSYRESLKLHLQRIPGCNVIGEAGNGAEAIALIQRLEPQVVLMDIDLPLVDGFSVVYRCRDKRFAFVVITSGEQHAFRAIKANAVDYLLKPAGNNELKVAIYKAFLFLKTNRAAGVQAATMQAAHMQPAIDPRLPVRAGNVYEMVNPEEIVLCKADNNYTEMRLQDKRKFLLSKTLKFYETRLKDQNFCRIHQSFLVNINFIKSLEKGRYSHIVLKDGTKLEIAQARKEQVFSTLGF